MKRVVFKILLLLFVALLWLWSFVIEPNYILEVNEVNMVSNKWDKSLGTLRIALVSDLHAGKFPWEEGRIARAVKAANDAKPDIIFLLGDYLNGQNFATRMDGRTLSRQLSRLKAPLGVYGIYGNHDAYVMPTLIEHILKDAGVKILSDSNVVIKTPRGNFCLAGIMDPITMPYSYARTFAGMPKDIPCILLTHSPCVYFEIPREAQIAFSGHTHGGQIRIPYLGALITNSGLDGNFADGLMSGDVDLYTTRGLGTSRIPLRFLCPPEITVINLSGTLERNGVD